MEPGLALGQPAPEPAPSPGAAADPGMGDMDMSTATGSGPAPAMSMMSGQLGAYPMSRDASGTSWQPDSAPERALSGRLGAWNVMTEGFGTLVYDDQAGPRGGVDTFFQSMLMGMGQRPLGGGVATLRGMFSLDPLMGKSGYPLLLQTGETADGRTLLVDRQHPHNLVMELAAAYAHPLTKSLYGFVYAGWPAEPALGPVTYMQRFSGETDPEAPIGHHWLDSTHVSSGVVTAGLVLGSVKLEASDFTGREPNQNRWDVGHPTFDSVSVRATWNPAPDLSLQVSRGRIVSPEQLLPGVNEDRTTASATYNRPLPGLGRGADAQATFAFGRDEEHPGASSNAFLLEGALAFGSETVFGRAEAVGKDNLFADTPTSPLFGRTFDVGKISVGYAHAFHVPPRLDLEVGGLASAYELPSELRPVYGSAPVSFVLFLRLRTGRGI